MRARARQAGSDLEEAVAALERLRRSATALAAEAEDRRRRAAGHAGGPLDPRAQGLWHAADFHAARHAAATRALAEAGARVAALRRAAAGRTAAASAAEPAGAVRPCA